MPAYSHPDDGIDPEELIDGQYYEVTFMVGRYLSGEYKAVEICKFDADRDCFVRPNNEHLYRGVVTIMPVLGSG